VRKADNLPPFCADVTKSRNLNFLEPSGPVQACNETALPFLFHGLYCSVRIKVFALAYLFSGECLVVTCVVVLESVFLQILAAAVSYGY